MPEIALPETHAEVFTLPNGLEIIVEEDHSAPVASVQAWVRTGSIHEGRWLGSGISHLLEHMFFKGTPSRGPQDFSRTVQDHGGYINAYTSFDRTVYWVDIPVRGVVPTLDLLADALMNSTLPADELVKEQEVIRREFAMGFDDPDNEAGKQLFATAFAEHPMRHPVIGHLDVFNAVTRDDLAAYYRERYAPNNIFFVIVGAVEAGAVRSRLAELFEKHPRRPLADVLIPREAGQLGRREQHKEFDTELTRMNLAWHVPAITHRDLPALNVLSTVLGSGRSALLYRRLREDLGIVHGVDAWCYTPASAGLFGIDALLDPDKAGDVRHELLTMVGEARSTDIAQPLLDKARRMFLSSQLSSLTTMRGKAADLGSNWLYARNLRFSHDFLAAAQHVTPAELRRVAGDYLRDENLTVTSLNPRATSARTVSRPDHGGRPATQFFRLPNGLRLLVREDARLPLVSVAATFKAGILAETAQDNGITRLLARTLLKGSVRRSAAQIAEEIESKGGAISSDSGNQSIGITARALQPDLASTIDLVADVIRNATLPDKAIAREKEVQLAGIKADAEEMTSVARNLLRARLFDSHPFALHALGTPESVNRLTRDDLAAFRDRHICAANGVISVFGAVNAAEVRALVTEHLGMLAPGTEALRDLPHPAPPAADIEATEHRPKAQAVLMVGFPGADMFSAERPALELIDDACSDLGSRLFNRIREEMGLAYFVGSSCLLGLVRGAFTFYVGTDPAKLTEVRAALREEIAKLAADGLDDAELARAKEKLLGAQEIRNQSNDALAYSCALDELYGLGHAHHEGLRGRIEAVTADTIRTVAARIFSQPGVTAIVRPS